MNSLLFLGICVTLSTPALSTEDGKPALRWDQDVTLEQFKNGFMSDNDLIIVFEQEESSPGCPIVPDDEIGIRLEMSQLMVEWKGIAKHSILDSDSYSFIQELEGNVVTLTTAVVDGQTLLSYDIVLWKHDALIGDGDRTRRSVYRVVDAASQMKPGSLYTFYWNRDNL